MAITFHIIGRDDGQYVLRHYIQHAVDPDGNPVSPEGAIIGTYNTGAEALHQARAFDPALTVYVEGEHPPPLPGVTPNRVLYSARLPGTVGFFPPPFDWESLPPCPKGITFPEVEHSEFIRFLRGGFTGLQFTYTVSPAYTVTESGEGGSTETITEDSVAETEYQRTHKTKCGARNCQKAKTYASGVVFNVEPPFGGGAYFVATRSRFLSNSVDTSTPNDGDPPVVSPAQIIDNPPTLKFGFFRASDNTRKVSLCFYGQGTADVFATHLYIFAPVIGADFHDVYGIPAIPESGTGDAGDPTYSEVTGNVTFLGVNLQVWGWKAEFSYDHDTGSGNGSSVSEFSLVEL